jgi:hypothetical protein
MWSKDLVAALCGLDESPWANLRGEPLNATRLASMLRPYEVGSAQVRIGEKSLKGYCRASFYDAWQRYVLLEPERPEQPEQTSANGADRVSDGERVPEHDPEAERDPSAARSGVPRAPDVPGF